MLHEDELIYTTSKITAEYTNDIGENMESSATGIFYKTTKSNGEDMFFIISNRHFFKNRNLFKFSIPVISDNVEYVINFKIKTTPNISENYDIGAIYINDAIKTISDQYYIKNKFIENDDLLKISSCSIGILEEAITIGYPFGIFSDNSTLPLIRKGIISTPLYLKYDNKEEFLVDIFCFKGTSGSPIFLNKNNNYYLIGIEYCSLESGGINIGLGKCVNSNAIKEYLQELSLCFNCT